MSASVSGLFSLRTYLTESTKITVTIILFGSTVSKFIRDATIILFLSPVPLARLTSFTREQIPLSGHVLSTSLPLTKLKYLRRSDRSPILRFPMNMGTPAISSEQSDTELATEPTKTTELFVRIFVTTSLSDPFSPCSAPKLTSFDDTFVPCIPEPIFVRTGNGTLGNDAKLTPKSRKSKCLTSVQKSTS